MRSLSRLFLAGAAVATWLSCPPCQAADSGAITVTPRETDELLANPGMGWETFHTTSKQDKNLPKWLPSTVHYARWGWGELEPRPGRIAYELLDRTLRDSRESGQKLAFRVMCCSTSPGRPYHPNWIKEVGGRELICDYQGTASLPIPDLDDPAVLQRHLAFIKRLGERYDGHPDIDHVDLGSVGWWGEWHLSGSRACKMPAMETRTKIVDAYLAAFPKTPLLMLIGGGECLTYATERGAGWRADCLGDMGGFSRRWCHMRQAYPTMYRESKLDAVWQKAPVAWETCWDMRKWVEEGWPLRHIFNYALALHASYLNNKSAPLPEGDDVRPEIERFVRRLGYRLVLKEFSHPAEAKAGASLEMLMKWQNTGSAPCYRPYRVAYRLTGPGASQTVLAGGLTVNRFMPGSVEVFSDEFLKSAPDLPPGEVSEVRDAVTLPADLPAGEYALAIAVVGEKTETPVVRLAIQGRAEDGWYPLSRVRVGR